MPSTFERKPIGRRRLSGLSENQQHQSQKAFKILHETQRPQTKTSRLSSSFLPESSFQHELELQSAAVQKLVRVIQSMDESLEVSFIYDQFTEIDTCIFTVKLDQHLPITVFAVSNDDEKNRVLGFLSKMFPSSKNEDGLKKNRITLQFAREEISEEKIQKSFRDAVKLLG